MGYSKRLIDSLDKNIVTDNYFRDFNKTISNYLDRVAENEVTESLVKDFIDWMSEGDSQEKIKLLKINIYHFVLNIKNGSLSSDYAQIYFGYLVDAFRILHLHRDIYPLRDIFNDFINIVSDIYDEGKVERYFFNYIGNLSKDNFNVPMVIYFDDLYVDLETINRPYRFSQKEADVLDGDISSVVDIKIEKENKRI